MQESGAAEVTFEALWKIANETPVERLDAGAEEEVDTAAALGGWIGEIADACRGVISEADHAELQKCGKTVARILGAVPPDKLRARLATLGPEDPVVIG